MSTRAKLVVAPRATSSERILAPRVGRLVAPAGADGVRVDFDGNTLGPIVPRVSTAIGAGGLAAALAEGQDPVLVFDDGDPARPVVVALVPGPTPLLDAVLSPPAATPADARVDGRRVVIEGTREVVLRCGKASIVLRADGQVTVRGMAIRSEARGVHKVRGGKVEIN